MKKLPLNIQDFKEMITGNYIYVDKTSYIYELIEDSPPYLYLGRPVGFGKSLLLSTLYYLFKGEKVLFKGLYIENKWKWENYPVIKFTFNNPLKNEKDTNKMISNQIKSIIKEYDIKLSKYDKDLNDDEEYTYIRFKEVLYELNKKYKKKVVILIEENFEMIAEIINKNIKETKEITVLLRGFYSGLKGLDKYLKMLLITGDTRFEKTTMFGGLNNLYDISDTKDFANICGFTIKEIKDNFSDYLQNDDIQKIEEYYNGYRFNGETIYNPTDIIHYLHTKNLESQLYNTKYTKVLIDLIKEKKYNTSRLDNILSDSMDLNRFDVENIYIIALMFQLGYLSIKDYIKEEGLPPTLKLGFANKIIKNLFNYDILKEIIEPKDKIITLKENIKQILIKQDINNLKEEIQNLINSLNYQYFEKKDIYFIALYSILYLTELDLKELWDYIYEKTLSIDINQKLKYIIVINLINERNEEKYDKKREKVIKYIKENNTNFSSFEKIYIIYIELDQEKGKVIDFKY
ncbi:MAG: AAA family ATPase, partial [bacterium]